MTKTENKYIHLPFSLSLASFFILNFITLTLFLYTRKKVKKTLVKSFRIVVETQIVFRYFDGGGVVAGWSEKRYHKVKEEGERSTLNK
jgi:hypothetical protein